MFGISGGESFFFCLHAHACMVSWCGQIKLFDVYPWPAHAGSPIINSTAKDKLPFGILQAASLFSYKFHCHLLRKKRSGYGKFAHSTCTCRLNLMNL